MSSTVGEGELDRVKSPKLFSEKKNVMSCLYGDQMKQSFCKGSPPQMHNADNFNVKYKGTPPLKKCFLSGIAQMRGGEAPARIKKYNIYIYI